MAIYENLTIEKGMYGRSGSGLTKTLEKLDPSENYKGTPLEGLDAFERQLKRFDIKVSGPGSEEYAELYDITHVAAVTRIDGMDYRSIASIPTDSELELRATAEGTAIPETNIHVQSNLVMLQKRGRMLVASYEALRFQRLDLFTIMLRQIGAYIARAQFKDAVSVIKNGDGNSNAAATVAAATSGTLTYGDLVNLWGQLNPYQLNTILAPVTAMLNMTQMQDANAGNTFHATGKMITPLGANLIHVPSMTAGSLIGLDKNYALEMVIAGDVCTEYDKLIDRQLERAAISCIAGFSKIFTGASKVLTVS